MAHAHHHLGADKVVKGEVPHASCGHERHAADRRAARAARHLHGGAAAHPEGRRHQPAGRNQERAPTSRRTSARSCSSYTADKQISINKQDVTIGELEERLRNIFEQRKDKTMFIAGAGTLRYRDISRVIDAAKGAGVEKVGIVTEGMRKAAGVGQATDRTSISSIDKNGRPSGGRFLFGAVAHAMFMPDGMRDRSSPAWPARCAVARARSMMAKVPLSENHDRAELRLAP